MRNDLKQLSNEIDELHKDVQQLYEFVRYDRLMNDSAYFYATHGIENDFTRIKNILLSIINE